MAKIYSVNASDKKVLHFFLSGSIGVGKTTVIDYLKKKMLGNDTFYFVQEYIDFDPDGKQMLERSLDGSLSLKDFQLYIVDQFYFQMQKFHENIHSDIAVCIWERHPMEALEVFARELNNDDKAVVLKAICKMLDDFHIPHLNGCDITMINSFNTAAITPMFVSDWAYNTILDMMASDVHVHCWCLLRCDLAGVEQYARIRRRGRSCEINEYAGNNKLMQLNIYYKSLYQRLRFEAEQKLTGEFDE